jgi:hypothetical protein
LDDDSWNHLNNQTFEYLKTREYTNDELFSLLISYSTVFGKNIDIEFWTEVKKIISDRNIELSGSDFERIFEYLPRSECRETLFISLCRLEETPLDKIEFSN